jgi:hypothetical protein
LIIEVDGPIHDGTQDADRERQQLLEAKDYTVLRFRNDEVIDNMPAVLEGIRRAANLKLGASPSPWTERGTEGKRSAPIVDTDTSLTTESPSDLPELPLVP